MLVTYFVNFRKLNDHLFGNELFIRFTAKAFRKLLSVYVFSYFPFGFAGRMWDLIVSVPDHGLSFYFVNVKDFHKYQTRFSEHNFIIADCQGPKSHTFYYSAMKDWNSLPEKLKTIQDNKKFKFDFKTFLQLHNHSKDEVVYMYYQPMDTVACM